MTAVTEPDSATDREAKNAPRASAGSETPPERSYFWLSALICALWAVATVWIQLGGFKHFEVDVYIPYHLSHAPLLSKLFDSHVLDADCYSARELSYFFDHIDCQVLAACSRLGVPHFMSATVLTFVVLLGLALWRFCLRDLRLGLPATCALTLLYLTTPFSMFSSWHFRTGKVGVALMTALAVMTMFRFYSREPQRSRAGSLAACLKLFALSSIAMLFDRQGFFLTALAICVIVLLALRGRGGHRWLLLLPLLCALAINTLYNHVLAPHLTWAFHGYTPNFNYQTMPLHNILERPLLFLLAGGGITVETMSFSFGNLPHVYFLVGWLGAAWLLWAQGRQAPSCGAPPLALVRQYAPLVLMLGVTASITVLNVLMVCSHTPLVWPDVRRFYYWLPVAALWFMLATILVHRLQQQGLVPRRVLTCALFLLVAGNLNALPGHRAIIRAGHLKKEIAFAPRLIAALRHAPSASEPLAPDIAGDVIYQLLKDGRNSFDQPAPALFTLDSSEFRVEVFSLTTNRLQLAFAPTAGMPCAARGALIKAGPSLAERSGLFGPMRLTAADGSVFRFSPRPLAQLRGSNYCARIRVVNKTAATRTFRVGSFVMSSDGQPLQLEAVGVDKWLFAMAGEDARRAAQRQTLDVPGHGSQELVYAYACDSGSPRAEMSLAQ